MSSRNTQGVKGATLIVTLLLNQLMSPRYYLLGGSYNGHVGIISRCFYCDIRIANLQTLFFDIYYEIVNEIIA